MAIDLVFITYNRLDYTKLALASILEDPTEDFSLTIWDNASTDGTVAYLKNEVVDRRITDVIFSRENIGQTAAINKIWSKSKADFLGKLDNDCLVTSGWTRTLAQAHQDIDNLGVVACWHFFPEDFNYEQAKHKIQQFGKHQILRHPWTCGTGLLIKQETFKKFGPIQKKATTQYWLKLALKGYINGFYYPLICQEHMDDPKSKHSLVTNDKSVSEMRDITYVLREHNIKNMQDRWERRKLVLENLNSGPWEAKYYVGWRKKMGRMKVRIKKLAGH